jgi:long-subunit acyl-CoA synthetase (AMP-forming)
VVANICVYASPDRVKPIAIIFPAEPALLQLAKENGVTDEGAALYRSKKLQSIVLKELQTKGRAGGLVSLEIIDHVIIAEEEWTPQNVSSFSRGERRFALTLFRIWSRRHRSCRGRIYCKNIRRRLTPHLRVNNQVYV